MRGGLVGRGHDYIWKFLFRKVNLASTFPMKRLCHNGPGTANEQEIQMSWSFFWGRPLRPHSWTLGGTGILGLLGSMGRPHRSEK